MTNLRSGHFFSLPESLTDRAGSWSRNSGRERKKAWPRGRGGEAGSERRPPWSACSFRRLSGGRWKKEEAVKWTILWAVDIEVYALFPGAMPSWSTSAAPEFVVYVIIRASNQLWRSPRALEAQNPRIAGSHFVLTPGNRWVQLPSYVIVVCQKDSFARIYWGVIQETETDAKSPSCWRAVAQKSLHASSSSLQWLPNPADITSSV